ncbi:MULTISPECIES: glycoside hydrolase family 65 protein [unclassified Agrococcus]|uniref:glycoside hydrolase family 65 protein n=1 Tax=unclassified Agrococcus TaxID=2615065 RepID=UPI003616DF81
MRRDAADPLDRHRYPIDEWALVETELDASQQGTTETLFAIGNGYLGMRGNVEEARHGHAFGTYVNGFHETWPIRHAEEAFGFARVGQTIIDAPDAKIIRLYVDDEPFVLADADLTAYSRRLDFQRGVLERECEWRMPSGKRIHIRTSRLVSFAERHLALLEYEVTPLDDASIIISSQLMNRQDMRDDLHARPEEEGFDPRKAETVEGRVLEPRHQHDREGRVILGYQAVNSGMTIAVGIEHVIETDDEWSCVRHVEADLAKHVFRIEAKAGNRIRLTKWASYHTARQVPVRELVDRSKRTLDRARRLGPDAVKTAQREWLDDFWMRADVEVEGQAAVQQAVRWNLFALAQAAARTDGGGIAAKGVSGSGYGGHYFWDTEVYVMPFLTYTSPGVARNALRFREGMLDAARARASEMNQLGALYPWRTINGQESSAYYAASTAQYHIDADIVHALVQYVEATGDAELLARGAIDILVETARMWEDLGFWRSNGSETFHIHGVTGPDEYTTVVNDNLYTNVMARANLWAAARAVHRLREEDPAAHERMVARIGVTDAEVAEWMRAAEGMHIPFDDELRVHPQDAQFLEREVWDLANTPAEHRPLLLHFHPLVIYRFQVLKQADVVLALLLQGQHFTAEEKRRDFEYYDALTTGDSTLSAVVQSIIAAEVGYRELALEYHLDALYVDLANLHGNTPDGVHVASTGGIWLAYAAGFGGMRDHDGEISFDPRLPVGWEGITFRMTLRGTRLRIRVQQDAITFTVEEGSDARVLVRGEHVLVRAGEPCTVDLDGQGPVVDEDAPSTDDLEGFRRADGTLITASLPTFAHDDLA